MRVGDAISTSYAVTSRVPQGSHLGSVFFLVSNDYLTDKIRKVVGTELFENDAVIPFTCET